MWKFPWKASYDINSSDAIIAGDTIFVSSGYNKGCVLVKISGGEATEVWQNKNMRNHINCSVLWEGHIYGFDGQVGGGGKLTCLDLATGEKKWSQDGMGTGSLMIADGKLIILSEKGKLVIAAASPEGFKELASAEILTGKCWTYPVLANGRIYARNADGQLVCVDVRG
jgi:outer membrane protein assembly factor BamB